MSRFFGKVGYATLSEVRPGVWEDTITERDYFGDVTRRAVRSEGAGQVNDNLVINSSFSILADPVAMSNYSQIRYVEYMGTRWKVTGVEVQRPRLILSVGGVYNGPEV